MKGLSSAIRTLTLIPCAVREDEKLSDSLYWFVVVGLGLGLALFAFGSLWQWILPTPWPLGGAVLLVALEVFLTRGLHLDGLADWADSIGGFGRERRLAIMKDVSVGAFGSLALILDVVLRVVIFSKLMASGSLIWILVVTVIAKDIMVGLTTTLPYARAEGGMAGPFVAGASREHWFFSHCLCLVVCLFFGPLGVGLFFLGWGFTALYGKQCRKQFGGITGDLLGTANEMVSLLLLLFCAVWGKEIMSVTGWFWLR
ncbi:MAG: adenosylcobinamide-GDP ribazoletransferase [Deltaproteobacteria bacterium]|nr:adenosylcobinamide-GDP ribazoletransferase [Deltaproteobacteria bacterium]